MSKEWVETTLGEIAEIRGGGTPSTREPSYWNGDVVWLTPTEVVRADGQRVSSSERRISQEGLAHSSAKLLPPGAVLLTSRASVGFTAIADVPLTTNQGFQSLIPQQGVLSEFLMYWIQGNRDEFSRRASGSTFPEISKTKVASISILIPPLPVQRRIADVMAHLDDHLANLRAEREFGASLLAQLREALSVASDPVPLGELAAVDGIQIGPFGSQLHASEYVEVGIPVVMPRDITEGRISSTRIKQVAPETAERLSRHQLSPGDIVFPRRGDLSKRALVTAEQANWLCGTGCIRFRPALGIDGGQIFQALSGERATAWLVEHAVGTTMLNLNTQILNNLPVPDPRVGESPVAVACEALAGLLAALAAEESRLARGRGALLSSLLSGAQEIEATYDTLLLEAS